MEENERLVETFTDLVERRITCGVDHHVVSEDTRDDVVRAAHLDPWSQKKRDKTHGQGAALGEAALALVGLTYTCGDGVVNVDLCVKPHVRV